MFNLDFDTAKQPDRNMILIYTPAFSAGYKLHSPVTLLPEDIVNHCFWLTYQQKLTVCFYYFFNAYLSPFSNFGRIFFPIDFQVLFV